LMDLDAVSTKPLRNLFSGLQDGGVQIR
jgi:hypothetical protein